MKKKFQVGDKVKLEIKNEKVEGTIIDFDTYEDKIVFKVAFSHGEVDIDQKKLEEILLRRK